MGTKYIFSNLKPCELGYIADTPLAMLLTPDNFKNVDSESLTARVKEIVDKLDEEDVALLAWVEQRAWKEGWKNGISVFSTPQEPYIPDACRACGNHPSNGGTGICHCTLGAPPIR